LHQTTVAEGLDGCWSRRPRRRLGSQAVTRWRYGLHRRPVGWMRSVAPRDSRMPVPASSGRCARRV